MIITFVIPFYGADIGGGAETLCRRLAENLVIRGLDVEVLTTTIKSLAGHWSHNYYQHGLYDINGVNVRRFFIRPCDTDVFIPINHKLIKRIPLSIDEEIDYMNNAVNSDVMFDFIKDNKLKRIYFFIPYLFGTALNGHLRAPERSYLIPCLHDEGYAYMDITRRMFHRVNASLFLSEAEMNLAKRLYDGLPHSETYMLGCGVDRISGADGARFREKFGLGDTPVILYVGRRDKGKNEPLLMEYFRRYQMMKPESKLKYVSIGGGTINVPDEIKNSVVDLGFVSEHDKRDAYAAATMLCQPSLMESFSIVIMESWLCGRPVLVHADSAVTSEHAQRSNGGFAFADFPEFAEYVDFILENPGTADKMGAQGKEYVEKYFTWNAVCERFIKFVDAVE